MSAMIRGSVQARLLEHDRQLEPHLDATITGVIGQISSFLSQEMADYRGDTLPNSFRRVIEYRRPIGGGDVFEIIAEKSINTTAAGYCLRYFAGCAQLNKSLAYEYGPTILRLANLLMDLQHVDNRKARYGGYALAPKEGTASTFNAAMCGLGMIAAYRVTLDERYLLSAKMAATFLAVMNNPNPTYTALYGVTPIPAGAHNAAWNGFCDKVSSDDTITTLHTTWNLLACEFLKELYEVTGVASYQTLYQAARDWGAVGVTGFHDFWAVYHPGELPAMVSNNWSSTGLTVKNGAWHRRGESVNGSTVLTGACTAATSVTVHLGAGASAVTGAYNNMAIRMTSGASNAKGSIITAYDGATKVASILYPFPITPTAGDTYVIGLPVNTIGSDQMEYGIEALYATGYNLASIRAAYETICSWANADTGPFGIAYDSRICWPGYFRPYAPIYGGVSKSFGTQYDIQGIGPLLKFKKAQYPEHWKVSFEKAMIIPNVATLVDKDFKTVWSIDSTGLFEFSTVGTGTVKGTIGLGIVETFNA